MSPDDLDKRILAELAKDSETLTGLAVKLMEPSAVVLQRLQALGSLKRVTCARDEDTGLFRWERLDSDDVETVDDVEQVDAPAPAPAPAAALSLSDQARAVLAQATEPMSAGELIASLPPDAKAMVYALLSQRVRAGEFLAIPPTGSSRRYWLASRPLPAAAQTFSDRANAARSSETTKEPTPVPVHTTRKKRQPIIVRERQRVLELRLEPINNGDVIIQCESEDEGRELDEIFVPAADIPALIRALADVVAQS